MLVIDDDEFVRRSFRRVLGTRYEVLDARGGREALALLARDADFDALLCDLLMPDCDGEEFYKRLGTHAPELRERIVFATGGARFARTEEFLAQVHLKVLLKPFTSEQLLSAVEQTVAASPRFSEVVPRP